MEVEYDLTQEDLIAFQRHLKKHRPKPRQNSAVTTAIVVVAVLGLLTLQFVRDVVQIPLVDYLISLLPGVGVGALLSFLGIILLAKLRPSNALQKMLQDGRNAEKVLGWRRCRIDARAIYIESPFVSTTYLWEGVDWVAATDEHVFLYLTTVNAFPVPLRAFADARTFDAFVDLARRYQAAGGPLPNVGERGSRDRREIRPQDDRGGAPEEGVTRRPRDGRGV